VGTDSEEREKHPKQQLPGGEGARNVRGERIPPKNRQHANRDQGGGPGEKRRKTSDGSPKNSGEHARKMEGNSHSPTNMGTLGTPEKRTIPRGA